MKNVILTALILLAVASAARQPPAKRTPGLQYSFEKQYRTLRQLIQSHIGAVRAALESGIPTIRNKLSGHGQGTAVTTVPMHYAGYMLHLTATTIQFLVESEKAMK